MTIAEQKKQCAALRRVIGNHAAFAKLMDDEDHQQRILDMPHLADILETAIIAEDERRYQAEQEDAEFYPETDSVDFLDDLDPGEPARGNFGLRMAKIKRDKAQTKKLTKKAPAKRKTAKKAPANKPAGKLTYRRKNYKTKTVGNVCDGVPRKGVSVHTIAFEELLDGKVWNRVMLGTNQDRVCRNVK